MIENKAVLNDESALVEGSAFDRLRHMPVVTVPQIAEFRNAAIEVAKQADALHRSLKNDLWVAETSLSSMLLIHEQRVEEYEAVAIQLQSNLDKALQKNIGLSAALRGAQENFEERLNEIRAGVLS